MRPKGVITLLVVAAFMAGIGYLLSDTLVERGIEKTGEAVVGAKVEVDNLRLNLAELSISLDRLQVTNPNDTWKNLFEAGRISFDMELTSLTRKRVIINDVTIADIRLGTPRETDGKILKKREEDSKPGWIDKAAASLKKRLAAAPVLRLGILNKKIDADNLFATIELHSTDRLDKLQEDIKVTHHKWLQTLSEFDPNKDLARIETEIDEIKGQRFKNIDDLIAALEKSKRAYNTLNDFKKDIGEKGKGASEDLKRIKSAFASVDNWIAEDFDALKSRANLGNFTPQDVGTMLFGSNLVHYVTNLLPYIGLVRKYMPVAEQFMSAGKVQKPPRAEGQNVRFPLLFPKPDFLIENIFISGATAPPDTSKVLQVSGQINGITSHPRVYGKPLLFALKAQLPQANAYQLTGEFDHTGETAAERFEVKASGIRFGQIDLPARPYLPSRVDAQKGEVSAQFQLRGEELDFKLSLNVRPVIFGFPDSLARDDVIAKVTRGVFDAIDQLQLSARISGTPDALNLSIHSNIDKVLAVRIQGVIGESAKTARAEIQQRLDLMTAPKKREVEALISRFQKEINTEINNLEGGINTTLAVIGEKKKELEKQIQQKTAKGIAKKLKNIFKN